MPRPHTSGPKKATASRWRSSDVEASYFYLGCDWGVIGPTEFLVAAYTLNTGQGISSATLRIVNASGISPGWGDTSARQLAGSPASVMGGPPYAD